MSIACLFASYFILSCSSSEKEESYRIVEISPTLSESVKKYSNVGEFHNGFAPVENNGRYGFIDTLGNEVIPCKYIGLSYNEPGFYTTYISNQYHLSKQGLIGLDGKRLTEDVYKKIEYLPDYDLICCYEYAPERFFKLDGTEVFPSFQNKEAIKKAEKYGELDKATPFFNDISLVTYYDRKKQSYYKRFIDNTGAIVIAVSERNGKMGVEDMNGKEIVPHKYEGIEGYDEGYILVSDGRNRQGLWSLTENKETVPPVYNIYGNIEKLLNPVHTFITDGVLRVSHSNGVMSLINPKDGNKIIGEEVGAAGFDFLSNGFIRVYFDDSGSQCYAVYNTAGQEVIGKHQFIDYSNDGFKTMDWVGNQGDRK